MAVAYVSLIIPMAIAPEDIGLNENCTDEELEEAALKYADQVVEQIHSTTDWTVNDIECDVREW